MRIHVHGKQIDVGESLRTHVTGRLEEAVSKYAERPVEATVTFSRDGYAFVCDASVHLSTGMTAQATSRAPDAYAAFEGCTTRMEKQLRRYKRRLKNHHQKWNGNPGAALDVAMSVLQAEPDTGEEAPEAFEPVVIAETRMRVRSLSVGEAVMQLELASEPCLVFRNDSHGGINVVYRRSDGNIGWIDPRLSNAT
jgi:ribosomal subunit interface protein